MKEPYSEGVAHHTDLESWGGSRKGTAQALTEASTSQVLSHERVLIWDADALSAVEGNTVLAAIAQWPSGSHGVRDLARVLKLHGRNLRDPETLPAYGCRERAGKPLGVIRR